MKSTQKTTKRNTRRIITTHKNKEVSQKNAKYSNLDL